MDPRPSHNPCISWDCRFCYDSSIEFFENKSKLSSHGKDIYEFTDKNTDLQVVPCSSDIFERRHDEELAAFHTNVRDCARLVGSKQDGILRRQDLNTTLSTSELEAGGALTNPEIKTDGEIFKERKESDSDSLDVYLKPCVITPTKVEDLYSTLEENEVFQFPSLNCEARQETQQPDLAKTEKLSGLQPFPFSEFIHFGSYIDNSELNSEELSHHDNAQPKKESIDCLQEAMTYTDSHEKTVGIIADASPEIKDHPYKYQNEGQFSFTSDIISSENLPTSSLLFPPLQITDSQPEDRTCVFAPKPKCDKSLLFTENIDLQMKLDSKVTINDNFESFQYGKTNDGARYDDVQSALDLDVNPSYRCFTEGSIASSSSTLYGVSQSNFDTQSDSPHSQKRFPSTTKETESENNVLQDMKTVHNDTEKQRRDQMKSRFECLRKVIPKVERLPKAPKILILRRAWEYMSHLQKEGNKLESSKIAEKIKNNELLHKLQTVLKYI